MHHRVSDAQFLNFRPQTAIFSAQSLVVNCQYPRCDVRDSVRSGMRAVRHLPEAEEAAASRGPSNPTRGGVRLMNPFRRWRDEPVRRAATEAAATPGTRSSISRGKSCPSRAAIGQPQVTQFENWYKSLQMAGATGLEPATFDVTGRTKLNRINDSYNLFCG
jgi:hypothetical protein